MPTEAIEILYEAHIAVTSLPSHTSDRLQPYDVSVLAHSRKRSISSSRNYQQRNSEITKNWFI